MKRYAVRFAAVAERHVRVIAGWWEANRAKSPGLFQRAMAEAVEQITDAPHSGSRYRAVQLAGVPRLLLRGTDHHVYYTIDEESAIVTVRAVWHATRGRPPRLR